jgi:hypothetical protein
LPEYTSITPTRSQGLVDVLDRILDKGLVIAGDVRINLANVELLTIRVRLLVCSIDKAEQIGLNWWKSDPTWTRGAPDTERLEAENAHLRERLQQLERRLDRLAPGSDVGTGSGPMPATAPDQAEADPGPRELRIP